MIWNNKFKIPKMNQEINLKKLINKYKIYGILPTQDSKFKNNPTSLINKRLNPTCKNLTNLNIRNQPKKKIRKIYLTKIYQIILAISDHIKVDMKINIRSIQISIVTNLIGKHFSRMKAPISSSIDNGTMWMLHLN